ncbi:MAG: nitronate monooxygenase family protein [Eubacteriales bacterium]|nr:nitronate monooxygenase family protein [Eubacteriales bacterium]
MKSIYDLTIPIIQGGMGVGISKSRLAGAVAKEGAMGTIASVGIAYGEDDFYKNAKAADLRILPQEIAKAKEISEGNGGIAVNIMVATTSYADMCITAAKSGADAIISGAGLPLNLPELVAGYDTLIAPIVSSAKALKVVVQHWAKKYGRTPDFAVIEGPKAGGHLGFKIEDLNTPLENILKDCVNYLKDVSKNIPLFVAGGVNTAEKVNFFRSLGAWGAQIGTRFILTEECDAHPAFKEKIRSSADENVGIIKSPVGLPGQAVKNAFFEQIQKGRIAPKRCVNCLTTCNPATTHFCICEKLIQSVKGDAEQGLVFSSAEIGNWNQIVTVKEVLRQCWNPK